MNQIKIVKPDGESIYDWMCTSEGLAFDFLIGFDSDEETLGNIAELIESALSQCTLECPLEWEDQPEDTRITSCGFPLASSSLLLGFVPFAVVRVQGKFRPIVMGRFMAIEDDLESLEAAKQAAQDFVNEKLNGGCDD